MNFLKTSSERIINLDRVLHITVHNDIGEEIDNEFTKIVLKGKFGIIIKLDTQENIIFLSEKAKIIWNYLSTMSTHITEPSK